MIVSQTLPSLRNVATVLREGEPREVGLTDGRNVKLDYRWGGNHVERLHTLASELVALAPDVLLAGSRLD